MCHWQGWLGQIIPGELLTWHYHILLVATLLMASLKSGKRSAQVLCFFGQVHPGVLLIWLCSSALNSRTLACDLVLR